MITQSSGGRIFSKNRYSVAYSMYWWGHRYWKKRLLSPELSYSSSPDVCNKHKRQGNKVFLSYRTLASLIRKLFLCLHVVVSSCRLFNIFFFFTSLVPCKIASFPEMHKLHLLPLPLNIGSVLRISHSIVGSGLPICLIFK